MAEIVGEPKYLISFDSQEILALREAVALHNATIGMRASDIKILRDIDDVLRDI